MATGGWFETYAAHFGVRAEAMVSALNGFVALYPDICIGGMFTLFFWAHSVVCLWLTLLALTVMVPGLVTRDRATHALTVYLSRPLTSADYLIGKLGVIGGVIGTIWTGPLVAGWLLSMLFAPDRDFLTYSYGPFLHALLFNAIGIVALSAIALGVSAVSRTSRNTVLIWLGLWLVSRNHRRRPGDLRLDPPRQLHPRFDRRAAANLPAGRRAHQSRQPAAADQLGLRRHPGAVGQSLPGGLRTPGRPDRPRPLRRALLRRVRPQASSRMSAIVEAENLSRFYGVILGLNNVTFALKPGITGVVGPNGSGKTTLFRLLTGQIRPGSGSLKVFGALPWNHPETQSKLAYCPEGEAVPAGLGPTDWLVALGMLSGLSARAARERARATLDRVKLAPEHWSKPLTKLSKGMRQRVKLAQCLLHDPQLVILDEPMNGLDPMGREDFGNVLRTLAAEGKSIVISSHILQDLEALCGEFLLRWGRIPRAASEAVLPGAKPRWPEATAFRCDSPERLARFFFDAGLVRGCEISPETRTLEVRWTDPGPLLSESFHRLLLGSGVPIFEVRPTASLLEKAIEAPPIL